MFNSHPKGRESFFFLKDRSDHWPVPVDAHTVFTVFPVIKFNGMLRPWVGAWNIKKLGLATGVSKISICRYNPFHVYELKRDVKIFLRYGSTFFWDCLQFFTSDLFLYFFQGFVWSRVFWKRNLTILHFQDLKNCILVCPRRSRKEIFSCTRGHFEARKLSVPQNPPHWAGDDAETRNKVRRERWWKKSEKAGSSVSTTPTVPLHLVVELPGSHLDVS